MKMILEVSEKTDRSAALQAAFSLGNYYGM